MDDRGIGESTGVSKSANQAKIFGRPIALSAVKFFLNPENDISKNWYRRNTVKGGLIAPMACC